jgi:hypothetical protein
MATIHLPPGFEEFLRLIASRGIDYLLVGGNAVAYHGYPCATADLDIWIASTPANAAKIRTAIRDFGFDVSELTTDLSLERGHIARRGEPPSVLRSSPPFQELISQNAMQREKWGNWQA